MLLVSKPKRSARDFLESRQTLSYEIRMQPYRNLFKSAGIVSLLVFTTSLIAQTVRIDTASPSTPSTRGIPSGLESTASPSMQSITI